MQGVNDQPHRKRVTLQQVADAAGVSRSAASFALTGRTDQRIAKTTVRRIREAAERLGYRPNQTAKTLRTGTSGTVGLISDFIGTSSHANSLVRGALEELQKRNLLLFAVDTQGDSDMEKKALRALLDRQVDGILYASMFTREVEAPEMLQGVPIVLLNCLDPSRPSVPCIVPDEYEAGCSAARLLVEAGHRDIAFAGRFPVGMTGGAQWRSWRPWALQQRLDGIVRTLAESGLRLTRQYESSDWEVESGRRLAEEMLREALPSALICVNDAMAFGVVQTLRNHGVRVPEDISVVGFDGSEWAGACEPELATVCLPQEEMGRLAVSSLLGGMSSGVTKVPMPVRKGASVAPVRV